MADSKIDVGIKSPCTSTPLTTRIPAASNCCPCLLTTTASVNEVWALPDWQHQAVANTYPIDNLCYRAIMLRLSRLKHAAAPAKAMLSMLAPQIAAYRDCIAVVYVNLVHPALLALAWVYREPLNAWPTR